MISLRHMNNETCLCAKRATKKWSSIIARNCFFSDRRKMILYRCNLFLNWLIDTCILVNTIYSFFLTRRNASNVVTIFQTLIQFMIKFLFKPNEKWLFFSFLVHFYKVFFCLLFCFQKFCNTLMLGNSHQSMKILF